MNLTISIDDRLLERARALARKRGISLQDLLRQYLESLAGEPSIEETADELMALMKEQGGRSRGAKVSRDHAYRGRV